MGASGVHRARCSNGHVLDLSASAARVQWLRSLHLKPGDIFRFNIEDVDGIIELDARVVWRRRAGWRHYQLGVEFLNVDDEQRCRLGLLVRSLTVESLNSGDVCRVKWRRGVESRGLNRWLDSFNRR